MRRWRVWLAHWRRRCPCRQEPMKQHGEHPLKRTSGMEPAPKQSAEVLAFELRFPTRSLSRTGPMELRANTVLPIKWDSPCHLSRRWMSQRHKKSDVATQPQNRSARPARASGWISPVLIVCSSSIQTARMIAGIDGRAGLVCRSEGNPSVLPSGRFQPLPIGTRLGSPCFSSGAEPAWTGSAPVPRGFRPTAGNSRPEAAGQRASGPGQVL